MAKIWNDETGSNFTPQSGVWQPEKPEPLNQGKFHDQGSDRPPVVKWAEDSDQVFKIRDKM